VHQRHRRAQAAEDVRELDADVAAADDRDPAGSAGRWNASSEVMKRSAPGMAGTLGRPPVAISTAGDRVSYAGVASAALR
jgi:hypothetical protein